MDTTPHTQPLVPPRAPDEWELDRQRTWESLGFVPYELPHDDSPSREERDFLSHVRSVEGENARLRRIPIPESFTSSIGGA